MVNNNYLNIQELLDLDCLQTTPTKLNGICTNAPCINVDCTNKTCTNTDCDNTNCINNTCN